MADMERGLQRPAVAATHRPNRSDSTTIRTPIRFCTDCANSEGNYESRNEMKIRLRLDNQRDVGQLAGRGDPTDRSPLRTRTGDSSPDASQLSAGSTDGSDAATVRIAF